MRAIKAFVVLVLVSLLSACASGGPITVSSARIVEERLDDRQPPLAQLVLQIDYTTTFNFGDHGEPMGFLVACGAPRDVWGHPAGYNRGLVYIEPTVSNTPNVTNKEFTVRFGPGGYERFFSATPLREGSADGKWTLQFEEPVKVQGLCFYVGTSGNLGDSPTSPDVRIDGMLQGQPAPK